MYERNWRDLMLAEEVFLIAYNKWVNAKSEEARLQYWLIYVKCRDEVALTGKDRDALGFN